MSSLDPPAKPGPVQSNVKPFTGFLPIPWENYILCLVFHLIVPLIPLVFERSFTGEVRPSSWLLVRYFVICQRIPRLPDIEFATVSSGRV